jgi:hypothetical protein
MIELLQWTSHGKSTLLYWLVNTLSPSPEITADVLRQATLQPHQAVNVLNDRVKLITTINASIADWLQVSTRELRRCAARSDRRNADVSLKAPPALLD